MQLIIISRGISKYIVELLYSSIVSEFEVKGKVKANLIRKFNPKKAYPIITTPLACLSPRKQLIWMLKLNLGAS